jgi:arginase
MLNKKVSLIGGACGWGAPKHETEKGPEALQQLKIIDQLHHFPISWKDIIKPSKKSYEYRPADKDEIWKIIIDYNERLADCVSQTLASKGFPVVIGGDHSNAVGAWSGVVTHLKAHEKFGLIWVDAHMDAHTPETTPSHAIHGMPVASLLGYGKEKLINVASSGRKISPKHMVLLGVRSFEIGEADLLQRLGVRVYKMDEVRERGFSEVFNEALGIVTKETEGFGVSIDLDAFDPLVAPGTGTPVPNGFNEDEFLAEFSLLKDNPSFKALEIAEYNPDLDADYKTAYLIGKLLAALFNQGGTP